MIKTLSYFRRMARLFLWRLTGDESAYAKLQASSSRATREDPDVQKNIALALNAFLPLLENQDAVILDAGCGDGWTMDQIRNTGYANIHGIDINDDKLATAKRHGHLNVSKTLLPNLDFEDKFFDAIFCRHVYEHLLYPQKTLVAFHRTLKPHGILFLITPKSELTPDSNESHMIKISNIDEIVKEVEAAGFTVISQEEHNLEELEFWVTAKKTN